jgi:hypothetical protein
VYRYDRLGGNIGFAGASMEVTTMERFVTQFVKMLQTSVLILGGSP